MAKLERNGIQRQIATLGDELPSDAVEDYVAEHGGEGGTPLPENIVIDPDYVHTDNNYDNAAAEKLGGLQNYDDTAVNEAIRSETARAAEAEDALQNSINDAAETAADYTEHKTPPYSIVNVAMQYDTDYNNVQLGVTWFYKDTESTQTFYNNIPVADENKTGLIAKEDIQAIRSNTAAAANIPTQLADLLVQAQNYTNNAINEHSQAAFRYKEQVATIADLPSDYAADEHVFELWSVVEDSHGYYWFGGEWNILDFNGVNLDAYSTTAEIEAAVNAALAPLQQWQNDNTFVSSTEAGKAYFEQDGTISVYGWGGLTAALATAAAGLKSHTGNGTLHVSSGDRTAWNGKQNALTLPLSITQGGTGQKTKSSAIQALFGNAIPDIANAALLMSGNGENNTGYSTQQQVADVLEPKIGFVSRNTPPGGSAASVILNDVFSGSGSLITPIRVSPATIHTMTVHGSCTRIDGNYSTGIDFTVVIDMVHKTYTLTSTATGSSNRINFGNYLSVIEYADTDGVTLRWALRYNYTAWVDIVLYDVYAWNLTILPRTDKQPLPSVYTAYTRAGSESDCVIKTDAAAGWTIAEIQNADTQQQFVRRVRYTNNTGAAAALPLAGVAVAVRSYSSPTRWGTMQELKQGGLTGCIYASSTSAIAYDYVSGSIANNGMIDLLIRIDK